MAGMHWTCLLAVHFTLADAALGISRPRRACWREADSSLTSEAQLSLSETGRQADRNRVSQLSFLQKTPQPRNHFVQFFHPSQSNQLCCGLSSASNKSHTACGYKKRRIVNQKMHLFRDVQSTSAFNEICDVRSSNLLL